MNIEIIRDDSSNLKLIINSQIKVFIRPSHTDGRNSFNLFIYNLIQMPLENYCYYTLDEIADHIVEFVNEYKC